MKKDNSISLFPLLNNAALNTRNHNKEEKYRAIVENSVHAFFPYSFQRNNIGNKPCCIRSCLVTHPNELSIKVMEYY